MTAPRPLARAALSLGLLAAPSLALAQNSPAELARRDLIRRAEAARRAGDHALAADLGGRAVQIRSTPSLRMMVAQESEAIDRPVDALDHARNCVREAEADPRLRFRARILATCRAVASRAEGRVGSLVVNVPPSPPEGLRVRVNGAELPPALWGVAYPLAPGAVVVEATAPSILDYHARLDVTARGEATATLAFQPRPPPPPPAPPPAPPQPARVCIPGQQLRCACPGGAEGTQTCNAQGSGLELCSCPLALTPPLRVARRAPPTRSYAAQTLLVDLAATAIMAGGLLAEEPVVGGIGGGVALLGGPVVHLIHRRPMTALGDFFIRAGVAGAGALSAYAAVTVGEGVDRNPAGPMIIGASVGYVIALIIDAYALAEYTPVTAAAPPASPTAR